jgi:hypothetical protein
VVIIYPEEEGSIILELDNKKLVKNGIFEAIYLQVLCKES